MRIRTSLTAACLLFISIAVPLPASGEAARMGTEGTSPGPDPADLPDEVIEALEHDLGVPPDEVEDRLAREAEALAKAEELARNLRIAFGGAWITDEELDLVVAVTDPEKIPLVEAAGAVPKPVTFSEFELNAMHKALDTMKDEAPDSVTSWYVHLPDNKVVVVSNSEDTTEIDAFLTAAGVDPAGVRVEVSDERPELLYDVQGGDAYYGPRYRCSIGFSVGRGFVTAGHCGQAGLPLTGYNRLPLGVMIKATFPGSDHALVTVNSAWKPRPVVSTQRGNLVEVRGQRVPLVGASICRTGSTTGWRCGILEAKNQTVRYAQGTVTGLTRSSACAEGGDSGGPVVWWNQAQGLLSGGYGNCTTGGKTFYQPLGPVLDHYGLTLVMAPAQG